MIILEWAVYLAIISARRPHAVQAMAPHCPQIGTWYVAAGEAEAYATRGAAAVVEAGTLCQARNRALRDAWHAGYPCLQVSDDLRSCLRMHGALAVRCTLADVVMALQAARQRYPAYPLGGVAPTNNRLSYHPGRPIGTHHFVIGDCMLVAPCDVFFDEALQLKEDYDYTLQHLVRYGGVVRCNDLLLTFTHRSNAGGAVAYRTPMLEAHTIAYLQQKWPGYLRAHPRRAHEVLLRWPSTRSTL